MSTEDDVEALAKVLARHQRMAVTTACTCGTWPPPGFGVEWTTHLAEQVAPLLAATAYRARREGAVEALAAKWEAEAERGRIGGGHPLLVQTYAGHARELRDAITGSTP